jgi:DNA-binding response OmpR family regulator
MVVDDEQNIREIISEFLKEMGYSVTLAVDGLDALDKVQYEQYELYIVDVYMPRMNGLEFLVKLKELQPLAVVIITTGYSSIDVAIKAIRSGAYHYLTKPIQAEELMKVVESGLKHSADLGEVSTLSLAPLEISSELIDLLLLRGFNQEQQREFKQIGKVVQYAADETIPLKDDIGTMIWVESGKIAVSHNNTIVDFLKPGDIWGEETFFSANQIFTELTVQNEAQIRHFPRSALVEFFRSHEETLTKRYMINLIQCVYMKWRRAIYKIGLFSGFNGDLPGNER